MIGTCSCAFAIAGRASIAGRHSKTTRDFFMDKISLRMRGMPCAIEKATLADVRRAREEIYSAFEKLLWVVG
jgi:hypothetical protein